MIIPPKRCGRNRRALRRLHGGGLHRLDVELDVHAIADQDAPGFEKLVPLETEAFAVDRSLADESDPLVAPRIREVEDAERAVSSLSGTPRGLLRVTAGLNAAWLGDIMSGFLKRYPEVQVELLCTGRAVDLVEERFDVGIRAGTLADSTLIARSLGRVSWFFVATAAYLKRRGRPKSPENYGTLTNGVGPSVRARPLEEARHLAPSPARDALATAAPATANRACTGADSLALLAIANRLHTRYIGCSAGAACIRDAWRSW